MDVPEPGVFISARLQERAVCGKLAHKAYEPPWKTIEVESMEDWWGLFALKASWHNSIDPTNKKAGIVVLDGKMSLISPVSQ